MYDIIKGNIYVDICRNFNGNFDKFSQSPVGTFRYMLRDNKTDWMSKIAANENYINGILKKKRDSIQ